MSASARTTCRISRATRSVYPGADRYPQAPGDTAFHDDCLLEQGRLETTVSRETFAKETCANNGEILRRNRLASYGELVRLQFGGVPPSTLNSGVTRFCPTDSSLPRAVARGTAPPVLMATKLRRPIGHLESYPHGSTAEDDHRSASDHRHSRISRCLVHSSGSGALCLSAWAVSVAGCDHGSAGG